MRFHESASSLIATTARLGFGGRALGITRPGTMSTLNEGRLDASTRPCASRTMPRVVGMRDAANDVLVRRLRVLGALDDLELEEPHADDAEREEGDERHPAVPLPELADVRPRDEERAHARPPVSFGDPDIVAWWMRCAMRKTSGATAPVASTCGSAIT